MTSDPLKELHDQRTLIKDRVRGVVHGHGVQARQMQSQIAQHLEAMS